MSTPSDPAILVIGNIDADRVVRLDEAVRPALDIAGLACA